jgi:thiol-disulfide isomerase/thioredoxin
MPDSSHAHVPPPPPKPRFFETRFWTGFGVGFLTCVFLAIAGSVVLVFVAALWRAKRPAFTTGESTLTAPALPSLPLPAGGSREGDADRLKLTDLDGVAFEPASLKGKVVFLNVWATWCGPCREEMPSIERLYGKVKDGHVAFVVVSDEPLKVIVPFARKSGWTFPVYRAEGALPRAFWSRGIPATFILAPDGRMAFKQTGSALWDDDSVVSFLNGLAAADESR